MNNLIEKSNELISHLPLYSKRYLYNQIDWNWRLNGIVGARGTGKTTMLLQHLKENFKFSKRAVYISLDDLYFSDNNLYDFIVNFRQKGGTHIYIDEVHKYKNWAREIKNIYDTFSDINIYYTGSSIIELSKQDVDLSRRSVLYHLHGLSFREFLELEEIISYKPVTLENLLNNHINLASEVVSKIKPLEYFEMYLKYGYYPFYKESIKLFNRRLDQVVKTILEVDINFIEGYHPKYQKKITQLLYILASNVPFKPNVSKLSEKIGIHRNTLTQYFHYLEKAQLLNLLYPSGISVSILQKPEKVYLNNPNLAYLFANESINSGTIRELFFLNQLKVNHKVSIHSYVDFLIDNNIVFEIGSKKKSQKQIVNIENAYIVSDGIEIGAYNKIPLWLFGFLY